MSRLSPSPTALILGNGTASARAAFDLAQAGVGVTLLTAADWLTPGNEGPAGLPPLLEAARHPRIKLLSGATVEAVENGGPNTRVTVHQSPRYVDPELCTACGSCTNVCPILLYGDEGDALHRAIYRGGVPTTYAIDKAGMAPCRHSCPISQRAQGYIALIRAGDFRAAYECILRENPFPSICGRVCNHRCEDVCSRDKVDAPVNIMGLKRFVADWAREQKESGQWSVVSDSRDDWEPDEPEPTGKKVAVVGAGPAGMTCALDLVRRGHAVTVYEALPVAGGMMRVGVPQYRLPYHVIQREIDEILEEGCELVLNHRVENVPGLLQDGFDAVFVAVGAHEGIKLPIPGADLPEAMVATDLLRAVSLRDRNPASKAFDRISGQRVLVLGGGNVAADAAMSAVRLGASWVGMACLESREQMPAHDWEVRDAEEEGIEVFPSRTFKEIVSENGHVAGVRCCQIDFRGFKDGRPDFDELPGTEAVIAADVVIFAIGQRPDIDCLQNQVETIRGRFPAVDPETLATSLAGVFAGGDAVTGTAFIVDAIAAGYKAAQSIDRYLRGQELSVDQTSLPAVELNEIELQNRLATSQAALVGRVEMKKRPAAERRQDFGEVFAGLTEAEALREAGRCLSCGVCSECMRCEDNCPAGAISHERGPQTWEFSTDVIIGMDAGSEIGGEESRITLSDLSGIYLARDDDSLAVVVEQALAHLNVVRSAPKSGVVAPVRRWVAPLPAAVPASISPTRLPGLDVSEREAGRYQVQTRNIRLGVFLCRCGGEIEQVVDLDAVQARVAGVPGVGYVGHVDFACHPEGNEEIRSVRAAHNLDAAVLAACSCCALDQICYSCTTQRTRCKERLGVWEDGSGFPIEFVNVREQCAFVHGEDVDAATLKAGDMVAASVAALSMTKLDEPSAIAELRLPITASIDLVRCRGCEDCEFICGPDAIHVVSTNGTRIAKVDASRCLGCGVCMAVCSSGAISASDVSDAQVEARLSAMGDLSGKTVIFSCNWGAYSAVEAAGAEGLSYDPSVRLVRLMCAGRAHDGLIMRAFVQGAAKVLVLTCGHDADTSLCHYHTGGDQARRSVAQTRQLLGLLGIDPARLAIVEMHPGDGVGFVRAIGEFVGGTLAIALEGQI